MDQGGGYILEQDINEGIGWDKLETSKENMKLSLKG